MSVHLCETVMAETLADLRARRDAVREADLVELRLDALAPGELDVAGALAGRRHPVIVTCRPTREGGRFGGSETERLSVLAAAARAGAEYVDVEWRADYQFVADVCYPNTSVVLSFHDLAGMPSDLADIVQAMRGTNAHVIKVAVTAARLRDCLTLRDAVGTGGRHVAIAMGEPGRLTRLLPAHFGSCWSYAGAVAPGQIGAAEMRRTFRVGETTETTRVFGVAGSPLGHSASPAMHNAAFRAAGLDAVYVPFQTDEAAELLEVACALGVEGLSVTAPLKSALLPLVDADEASRAMGAVNTLKRTRGGWEARNFDAAAFLAPLDRARVALDGVPVAVLGAGGAARAVAWALRSRGAAVTIAARDRARAAALAASVDASVGEWPPAPGWSVLVNATPVGTAPHVDVAPIDAERVRGGLVYDLVYNPPETRLLAAARRHGARTIGGLDMLVAQAARQFEYWTARNVSTALLARAAEDFVNQTLAPTTKNPER